MAFSRWRHIGNCRVRQAPWPCWICYQILCAALSQQADCLLEKNLGQCVPCDGPCRCLDAALAQQIGANPCTMFIGPETGTRQIQKAKKSAGANLLTLVFLGSPTWTRTRNLRINSQ